MKYIIALLLLSGCTSTNGVACPAIRSYTRQEQINQANAEEKLPTDSPLVDPLLEWARLRQEIKACNGK